MKSPSRAALSSPLSILLDGIRFSAAVIVLFGHFTQSYFSVGWPDLTTLALAAVGAFFVLSGFVIEYTAPRHPDFKDYFRARLVRLWSVVIPAMIYTALADLVSWAANPNYYASWLKPLDSNFTSFFADILFLNQSWGQELSFGSDNPIWSLGYEAAYYVLFGAFFYFRGPRRILIAALLIAIKGPQFLILFPIWLLGVLICRMVMETNGRTSKVTFVVGVLSLCLAIVFVEYKHYHEYVLSFFETVVPGGLGRSSSLFTILASGLATSGLIVLAAETEKFWAPFALRIAKPVRWLAQSTFSIYLFHFPTLVLIQATTNYSRSDPFQKAAVFVVTFCVCIALSFLTERRKSWWDEPVRALLSPLNNNSFASNEREI